MRGIRFWYVMLARSEAVFAARSEPPDAAFFRATREYSVALAASLSPEDCTAQSMPDASPVKWHLAHSTWFFETFILERFEAGFKPFDPAFRVLFNSYYNGVGEKYSRAHRGLLTRPALHEVLAYRRNVDARISRLLAAPVDNEIFELLELGLQHEQQHQELIVTDAKHLLSFNPLYPPYRLSLPALDIADDGEWLDFREGVVAIGHDGGEFCFDNEMPRHRQFVEAFALAPRLVTNAEFAQFIADGGYDKPEYWLSEGWNWVRSNRIAQPLYWRRETDGWREFTLDGLVALRPGAALLHVSYFEAAAFAVWAKARLPTEAEWEVAAKSGARIAQMFGTAWQWTSSAYTPYPGFVTAPGAVGEYNGKFMVNQYVLRGSSLATPDGHSRASYRNFFPADARWQFSGIRLAR
jgi:ergothioneine biosynthesis protein EgtB